MLQALQLDVSYAARRPWAPRPGQFKQWAEAALAGVLRGVSAHHHGSARGHAGACRTVLSVRVVGTARSRSLNARYRHRDRPTNVLSFGSAGSSPDGIHYLGELVICAPVVAHEAKLQGKPAVLHWAHMTVHGVLHLLGFDHESPADSRKMESSEIRILDGLGFADPYG